MSRAGSRVSFNNGSFRDPAGYVFQTEGVIYRQVNKAGKADFDFFLSSGLYDELAGEGLIVAHSELQALSAWGDDPKHYKILKPTLVPFISYPYEWTFNQLKAAALLTLEIQKKALARGMILKDASAYNVQFIGRRPIFIDTLSFRVYEPGSAWDGYRQFCEHFIAPLAVASYGNTSVFKTLRVFLDGLPLGVATQMLPSRAKLRRGLAAHLYLHSASQRKHNDNHRQTKKEPKVSSLAMTGLLASLEKTIRRLKLPKQTTQWGDYYSDTNYTSKAFRSKQQIVSSFLAEVKPKAKMVWDLGANDGTFSEIAAKANSYVVSFDVDLKAVEMNFRKKRSPASSDLILPLLQDLANPSPALGWAHKERQSLVERGPADVIVALALVHHLAIGNNLPFSNIAGFFSQIGRWAIVEFVPKEDSKTQILLKRRANLFTGYTQPNFEAAIEKYFTLIKKEAVADSRRVIYLLKSKH